MKPSRYPEVKKVSKYFKKLLFTKEENSFDCLIILISHSDNFNDFRREINEISEEKIDSKKIILEIEEWIRDNTFRKKSLKDGLKFLINSGVLKIFKENSLISIKYIDIISFYGEKLKLENFKEKYKKGEIPPISPKIKIILNQENVIGSIIDLYDPEEINTRIILAIIAYAINPFDKEGNLLKKM